MIETKNIDTVATPAFSGFNHRQNNLVVHNLGETGEAQELVTVFKTRLTPTFEIMPR